MELTNSGASGSLFYVTNDDEFIVKTVQHKEAEFLQKLLPGYYLVSRPWMHWIIFNLIKLSALETGVLPGGKYSKQVQWTIHACNSPYSLLLLELHSYCYQIQLQHFNMIDNAKWFYNTFASLSCRIWIRTRELFCQSSLVCTVTR